MLNQIVLVGRLANEVKENEGEKYFSITLAVPRSFENENGEYETDMVPIILWEGIGENTKEYCHKGDVIGIKGRIEAKDNKVVVVAERVTFLSSKKVEEKE